MSDSGVRLKGTTPARLDEALEGQIRYIFRQLDLDSNNDLNREELTEGLYKLGVGVTEEQVDGMWGFITQYSGSERINYKQFRQFAIKRDMEIQRLFREIDTDNDGRITEQELIESLQVEMGVQASTTQARKLITLLDKDGDNQIDLEELRSFLILLPVSSQELRMGHLYNSWSVAASIDFGEGCSSTLVVGAPHRSLIVLTAGGIAGIFSRTATAPMDRLKILMQAGTFTSSSIPDGMRRIYIEGGLRGFFRGNGANVLKVIPESAVKFLTYDSLQRFLKHRNPSTSDPTIMERFACGAMAGAVSQTAIYPLETAKTRLAVSRLGAYRGIFHCLGNIVKYDGVPKLFRGLGPSILGIIPYAGVDMATFNLLKDNWLHNNPGQVPSPMMILAFGSTSGMMGQLISYPLQLIRTKLQVQGSPGHPNGMYTGGWDCFRQIVTHQGFLGLYRGIAPNFLKAVPAVSIGYLAFEKSKAGLEAL